MAGLLGYGRDFAQGASNAAASNVSGPVDGIAWLLRRAGLNIPENAIGSSQWMAEKGLTRQPESRTAGLLGETAGLLMAPMAQAKAPQIASGLLQAGDNLAAPSTMANAGQRGAALVPFRDGSHYAVEDLSQYTPKLYRETSIDSADAFLPRSTSAHQPSDLFFANEPANAMGQGGNRGVLMEFDANGMRGQLSMNKPGARMAYDSGLAEFISRDALPSEFADNLVSMLVQPGQSGPMLRRIENAARAAGFIKGSGDDGSVVFRRK